MENQRASADVPVIEIRKKHMITIRKNGSAVWPCPGSSKVAEFSGL
jgi:hypothetical protein